ncbi:OprO/OprP family phosphate-selective porin [Desulfocurvibacter africanus]|uniref:OprO/OprP family phosphate-selective porin n=1 Tax=Desulfocurvibacter africanus TaxID=873 RepID=UPI000481405B|nr:porin [Desulfocurvibacter africanus]
MIRLKKGLTLRCVASMALLVLSLTFHTPAFCAEGEDLRFYWDEGLKLDSADKNFRLRIGGRIQADWAAIAASDGLDSALEAGGQEPIEGFGTEFRRMRFNFQGDIYRDVFFKAQIDFAPAFEEGGAVEPKDVYVGYHTGTDLGDVMLGQYFAPFSLEAMTSSNYITFIERSIGIDVMAPSRRMGASLFNGAGERLTWQAGAFSTSEGEPDYDNEDNWFAAGRVTFLPWLEDDGERLAHVGASYAHQFVSGDNEIRYRARPEAHLAPSRLVDTDTLDADGSDLAGLEAALVLGPLSFQAEYVSNWVHRDDGAGDDLYLQSYYAFVSWFLTGEHRVYKSGVFSRVRPNNNFSPQGGMGAWELAARWSSLDLNSQDVRGGQLQDVTAGVNWYLNPNTRVMLNYVHAMVTDRDSDGVVIDDRESADIVQMRFQVDW